MHNIVIYYFSGTGNTKRIVDLYNNYFLEKGVTVTLVDITANTWPVKTPEAIGFAYPVHGFNVPKIVIDFVNKLANGNHTYTFIIKTSGEPLKINDASSRELVKLLKKKNYNVALEHYFLMPYNMVFRHTDSMASKMLQTATLRIPRRAQAVLDGKTENIKFPFLARFMAWICKIERVGFRINGRLYKVNSNKCLNCNMCVTNCPTNNIKTFDGQFKFSGRCVMCARCCFSCPTDAITIGLLNCLKVNGRYNFNKNFDDFKIGRYCHKAYIEYFEESTARERK